MTDRKTRTIDIRRCFAMVIAAVMALTMFTGVTGISHAAAVTGVKVTNYGFRMVRVSWSAVKVQVPQKQEIPASSGDPAEPADTASGSGEPAEPADTASGSGEPAADPNGEPAADPNGDTTGQGGDPSDEPVVQGGGEPVVDPNGDTTGGPAADPNGDPTGDPSDDLNGDIDGQGGDPADDPNGDIDGQGGDPAPDPADDLNGDIDGQGGDPSDDLVVQGGGDPAGDPAGDTTGDPAGDTTGDPAADPSGDIDGQGGDPADDPSGDIDGQGGDPSDDLNGDTDGQGGDPADDPSADPASDSVVNLMAGSTANKTSTKPVYDVITYKVYRSTAKSGKYKLIKKTKSTSFINKGLKIGKRYYYKVVAYRSNGKKHGTSSIVSIKVAKKVTAKMTLLKKGNKTFNFRIAAKQKLYQYDTLQGGCANGGYAYLTLYNRKVEKCKIVKVKLSNLRIVKVSAALPIYHGNNLTYNTKKKRIVATCCTTSKKAKNRVVLINPSTLKVTSIKNIKLTKKVKKLPKKVRKKNKGFTAIAYNEKHNCYVARLRQNDNIVILNKNLKPLRYVKLKKKKTWLLAQGLETVGNYIYDVRSFKGRYHYCMVTVHTMSGKYVGQMKFPYGTAPGKELQCIFHNGKQFYAGFYYSTSQKDDTKKNRVNRVNLLKRLNNM